MLSWWAIAALGWVATDVVTVGALVVLSRPRRRVGRGAPPPDVADGPPRECG